MKLFDKNEYEPGSDINFDMKVDPNLKPDTELDIDGKHSISYSELKDIYDVRRQDPIRCLIYWEDIMQYTSMSLVEILNSLFDLNAVVDFEHFLSRPNEYSNGLSYVFRLFENKLTKEQITDTRDKYFWKLMEMSIRSSVYMSVHKTSSFFNKLGFWFPTRFKNAESLKIGLKNSLMPDKTYESLQFHYGTTESFHDALVHGGYNSVITPNIISTYNFIIKNDLTRISIIGPEQHNGFTDEMYDVFEKYRHLPKPNYCSVGVFREEVMV